MHITSWFGRHTRGRALVLGLCLLAAAGIALRARPAAAVEPITLSAVMKIGAKKIGDWFVGKVTNALFGSNELAVVKQEIIAEIQKQKNTELVGLVDSLTRRYGEIAANPNGPEIPARVANFLDESSNAFFEMQRIIRDGDVGQGYHLTTAYNFIGMLRGTALATFNYDRASVDAMLKDIVSTDFTMIGARRAKFKVAGWSFTSNTTRSSRLYDSKRFAKKSVTCYPNIFDFTNRVVCNLASETCTTDPFSFSVRPVERPESNFCLDPALAKVTAAFDADSEVQVMRATMAGLVDIGYAKPGFGVTILEP